MASETLGTSTATEQGWSKIWYQAGPVKFAASGDRLLIVEDKFRSGYECRTCEGTGKLACTECGGTGSYFRGDHKFKCSSCEGTGVIVCLVCKGKGGTLVVPETSQRRPSTGKVVSVGEKVKHFAVGESVLYSNFAGHAMDIPMGGETIVLRILHESELLAVVEGHL